MSRVDCPRWPVRSAWPSTASRSARCDEAAGQPAGGDGDEARLRRRVQRRRPRAPAPRRRRAARPRAAPGRARRRPPRPASRPGSTARASSIARSVSPRYASAAVAATVSAEPSSSASVANGVTVHHGQAQRRRLLAHLLDRAQRRGAEVDRRGAAAGRRGPGGGQELRRRPDQLGRPGPDPLRVADQHVRAGRQLVQHQPQLVGQDRGQRLHALDRGAVGDPVQHLGQLRVLGREPLGPLPHRRGEQQLPARRRPQPVLGGARRALVGDREEADLLDVVAPELDPDRVLLGRREDVEDAAADGELAALLDQLDPRVADGDQALEKVVELDGVAGPRRHRLQLAEAGHLRLQHRADRGDHHPDRSGRRVVGAGMGEPAQHGQPPADRVRPRGQPLVRQRLPGRVADHLVGGQQAAQGVEQVLGVAAGRRDGQHRAAGAAAVGVGRERGGDERAQGRWRGEVERGHPGRGDGSAHGPAEGGIGQDGVEQSGQRHGGSWPPGQRGNPRSRWTPGVTASSLRRRGGSFSPACAASTRARTAIAAPRRR